MGMGGRVGGWVDGRDVPNGDKGEVVERAGQAGVEEREEEEHDDAFGPPYTGFIVPMGR